MIKATITLALLALIENVSAVELENHHHHHRSQHHHPRYHLAQSHGPKGFTKKSLDG